ncbi:MAG: hypothetical protein ACKO6N_22565 [Myxococcota bacterium]
MNPPLTAQQLVMALQQRWEQPTPAQQETLGRALWSDMLASPLGELLPRETFLQLYSSLMSKTLARYIWQLLPRDLIERDLGRLRDSGQTLGELLGPETCSLLREGAERPFQPNRELVEQLLDQPLLRQALKSMVQKTIQQFLSQISSAATQGGGGSGTGSARGSIVGVLGRSIAQRAEKAVQIGKTFVEGVGGTLFHQLEDQLHPFLSGFMQRSVKQLTEGLFSGEHQQELAQETRRSMLEVLLRTDLHVLMPEPTAEDVDRTLQGLEAFCARVTGLEPWQQALQTYLLTVYEVLAEQSLQSFMKRNRLSLDATPEVYQALGRLGYHYLTGAHFQSFLTAELQAVLGEKS